MFLNIQTQFNNDFFTNIFIDNVVNKKVKNLMYYAPSKKKLMLCLIINFWCQQQSSHRISLTITTLILTLTIKFTTLLLIQLYVFGNTFDTYET